MHRKECKAASLIEIRNFKMGEDFVFLITGGMAHIGATATAYKSVDQTIRVVYSELPDHREGELAIELAGKACQELGRTVSVIIGIHLDHPSKEDIAQIVDAARHAMNQLIGRLKTT